ncbi:AAA domain-containing protein [Methylocystis heyeri]|uniref:AAA domain-containing protein n=2 Tax=Methylocystis heyeri TaxID=391905 RepID=A0A6B8KK51_9HYPH|nr:AAA domain-containing protein [Methylocystis heyeri]
MKQSGQPPSGADWVRPRVAEAWARCIDEHHLPPGLDLAPRNNPATASPKDFELWRRGWCGAFAATLSAMVYDFRSYLDESSVTLLLSDTAGRLIYILDAGLDVRPGGVRMVRIGADWSEAEIGNTGIGTAGLLKAPAAFNGKEHFARAFHPYATAGCPILAPDGGLKALVGIVTDRRDAASLILGFLKLACQLLEEKLFDYFFSSGQLLRLRNGDVAENSSGRAGLVEGRIAVSEDGIVKGANQSALELVGGLTREQILGRSLSSLIQVEIAALTESKGEVHVLSETGRPLRVESRRLGPETARSSYLSPRKPGSRPLTNEKATAPRSAEWRDSILDTALQKAVNLQVQKIPLLITGESGVGKDYLVRRLHACGSRSDRPLVAINCAAIPRELIESELFGYEGGSFTGARSKGRNGKFVDADKGIIFLDEIGDMPLDLQATLLRVLESSEVVPIGGNRPLSVDVQVVAATNCSLQQMVQKGSFRRDLYYRLNGVQLWLPPLRERPDRLQLIAQLLRQEHQSLGLTAEKKPSDEVWRLFFKHPWPGNIREVRNVLRSLIAVTRGHVIEVADLPRDFLEEMSLVSKPLAASRFETEDALRHEVADDDPHRIEPGGLADWEARAVRTALTTSEGNVAKAARALGITRATLYHKMARYGLRSDKRIISKI